MRHADALEVTTVSLPMSETSQPGEARRAAMRLASRAGLDEEAAGKVGLAVTEAASNVVKHGRGGDVILRMLRDGEGHGVEMLALDRGAGMANIGECLRDGYSTSGTAGTGLGAIRRLSSQFDVHSIPGVGTAVLARFWNPAPPKPGVEVGAVCIAKPGELVCGDAWAVARRAGVTVILIVDGLGHGVPASDAAAAGLGAFAASRIAEPRVVLEEIHAALRPTRGAAVAVAALDPRRRVVEYTGLGNIAGAVVGDGPMRHMVSHNGIAGHEARRLNEFSYPWPDGALIVLHSDGLGTHWDLGRYSGLIQREPSLIAGVLYRDFARRRDDVVVVVAR